ncbi:hemerythrin domain-containing protein [Nocardia sp. IFM 10818]
MTAANGEQGPAIGQMAVIHRTFRSEFATAPALVRALRPGAGERVRLVTEHLRNVLDGLHIHHTGEDEILWPLVQQRAPEEAERVKLMVDQHERVDELVQQLTALLPQLAADPLAYREDTAAKLEELGAELETHMAAEEAELLPIVARHVTAAEWAQLGQHGLARVDKSRRLLTLSNILDLATPEERKLFLAELPAPVKVLWRLVGKRQLARSRARLYGAAA